jgi:hypothetical protein
MPPPAAFLVAPPHVSYLPVLSHFVNSTRAEATVKNSQTPALLADEAINGG